jgi:transcriptional regulator with XRE-family HTH domain
LVERCARDAVRCGWEQDVASSANQVQIEQIGERVRALVTGRYGERVLEAAAGIGISETDLSALLQGRASVARPEALAAALARVAEDFGVDPSWLVSGRYNVRSHVAAEELRGNLIGLRFLVHRLLTGPDRAVEMEPVERADMRSAEVDARPAPEWADGPPVRLEQSSRPTKARGTDEPER